MYIKASLQFHHLCLCKDFKDTKKWMKPKSNIISFVRGGCRPEVPQKNVLGFCQVVGIWHFCCRQWNGHMTIVRASP